MKKKILITLLATGFLIIKRAIAGDIVVIGNNNVPKMDLVTIQKIYTGKIVSISDVNVKPVNAKLSSTERNRFLENFMEQDEEKYTGYWTVRRYIGKGTPPPELGSTAEVINFVQSIEGAVGYIDSSELKTNLNVIGRK